MKRSEMLEAIQFEIDNASEELCYPTAETLLYLIEGAGMLPPPQVDISVIDKSGNSNRHKFNCEWEEE